MENYTFLIKKTGNKFVGLCAELNVSSQGDTLIETERALKDAVSSYLDYYNDTGIKTAPLDVETLKEFLSDGGGSFKIDKSIIFNELFTKIVSPYEVASAVK